MQCIFTVNVVAVENTLGIPVAQCMGMNLSKLQEIVVDTGAWHAAQSMGLQRVRHELATEQQTKYVISQEPYWGP